jgi:hypothetical protein
MQRTLQSQWKVVGEMGLVGMEAEEWEEFCRAMIHEGIFLSDNPDELVWTGNTSSGVISAKNAYDAIARKIWTRSTYWWHNSLWKWDFPHKLKLFTWLLMENTILTWENLQRRGRQGSRHLFPLQTKLRLDPTLDDRL